MFQIYPSWDDSNNIFALSMLGFCELLQKTEILSIKFLTAHNVLCVISTNIQIYHTSYVALMDT